MSFTPLLSAPVRSDPPCLSPSPLSPSLASDHPPRSLFAYSSAFRRPSHSFFSYHPRLKRTLSFHRSDPTRRSSAFFPLGRLVVYALPLSPPPSSHFPPMTPRHNSPRSPSRKLHHDVEPIYGGRHEASERMVSVKRGQSWLAGLSWRVCREGSSEEG